MRCILFCIISFIGCTLQAQKDSLQQAEKNRKTDFHLSLGADIWSPVVGLFSDRKGYAVLGNFQLYPKWFVQTQLGFEQNSYDEIGWKVDTEGGYFKVGGNYIITQDAEEGNNQFYVGLKFAYSSFVQDLRQVPIRAIGQTTQYTSFGEDNANAFWVEIPLGARVAIWKKRLFIETIFSTNILVHSNSDMAIKPVVIPNFGKDNAGINFNVYWGITWAFL